MSDPYWAVAAIQTSREDLVQKMLAREDFETYAPKIRIAPKRTVSLFPGYLIVRIAVRWYPVRWCPGVLRVLMSGERPAKLADDIVNKIRGQEVRGIVKLPKDPGALEPGQQVRVTKGMFAGRIAIYAGMNGPERERILLDLLGQSVPVNIPIGSIERVHVA